MALFFSGFQSGGWKFGESRTTWSSRASASPPQRTWYNMGKYFIWPSSIMCVQFCKDFRIQNNYWHQKTAHQYIQMPELLNELGQWRQSPNHMVLSHRLFYFIYRENSCANWWARRRTSWLIPSAPSCTIIWVKMISSSPIWSSKFIVLVTVHKQFI